MLPAESSDGAATCAKARVAEALLHIYSRFSNRSALGWRDRFSSPRRRERLCFRGGRGGLPTFTQRFQRQANLCPRSFCEGGRRGEFSDSNRSALEWRDRFSSSRSSDPSPCRHERLCFRGRRGGYPTFTQRFQRQGGLCPRRYCEGGRRSEFSNSNRCALGWRDRFSSSRSSDPSPSRRERLCFRDRRFSDCRHRTEGSTSTPPLTISGKNRFHFGSREASLRPRVSYPRPQISPLENYPSQKIFGVCRGEKFRADTVW